MTAARALGVRLIIANASTPNEIEPAIALLVRQGIGAFLTLSDMLFFKAHDQIAASAAKYRLPTIYFNRESVETGGLISYGASMAEAGHLAGTYIGRILKGEKPADLPVLQPTKFELGGAQK
jgi:putative ABC transport system substrate-binding protein